jgi:hypothetical protein
LLVAVLLLAPASARAFPNEPDGLGDARFGASVVTVKARFPQLVALTPPPEISDEQPITLEVHEAAGVSVLGLSPCNARFYFANDQLYKLGFDCQNDAKLFETLKGRFGPASQELAGSIHWLSDTRAVSVNPRTRRFAFSDRPLEAAVQGAVIKHARRVPEPGGDPSGAQTPAEGEPAVPGEAAAPTAEPSEPAPDFDWFDEEKQLQERVARLNSGKASKDELVALLSDVGAAGDAETAGATVAKFLKHPDELVFDAAIQALENFGEASSVKAIAGVLADPKASKERRMRALEALMLLRHEDGAAEALVRGLSDPDAEVRREAAMNLVMTGEAEIGVPALREAQAKEKDELTRQVLEKAVVLLEEPPKASPPSSPGEPGKAPAAAESPKQGAALEKSQP